MFRNNVKTLILVVLGLLVGLGLGVWGEHIYLQKRTITPQVTRINAQGTTYKYISPLLAVDDSGSYDEDKVLEKQINATITQYEQTDHIQDASVYYRGPVGDWVGIDESELYNPASLFKVPIMIGYLKQAETDPTVLTKTIKFDNPADQSPPQAIPPSHQIQFGQTYTVEQLIDYMIIYSDNSAANILADGISLDQQNSYTEMLSELGLPASTDQISAKTYSLFLRVLRNATYLNQVMSEKALSLLAQTDFKAGLSAGVPSNIEIAQKFGEYESSENGQQVEELHDCGMVYAPKVYLICVMTKGPKIPDLESLIKDISAQVYTAAEK